MVVGKRIKEIRKSKGISQKQLAGILEVTETMVSQYERGLKNPKIETLQKIANALQVSIADLREDLALWQKFDAEIDTVKLSSESNAFEAVQAAFGKTVCDILGDLSKLNKTGQEKAADYVFDLTEQPKYRK